MKDIISGLNYTPTFEQPSIEQVNPDRIASGYRELQTPPKFSDPLAGIEDFAAKNKKLDFSPVTFNRDLYKRYTDTFFGNSVFLDPRYYDNEEINARRQSEWNKLGMGTIKLIPMFGSSFAAFFTSRPWDYNNEHTREFAKIMDNWETMFPNFVTKEEQLSKNPIKGIIPFTTGWGNFWGDKIIKNIGFMAGAFVAAAATELAVTAGTGFVGTVPMAAVTAARFSMLMGRMRNGFTGVHQMARALALGEQGVLVARTAQSLPKALQAMQNYTTGQRMIHGAKSLAMAAWAAQAEASIETVGLQQTVFEEYLAKYREIHGTIPSEEEQKKIQDITIEAANYQFALNTAIIWGANMVQWGNLFKPTKLTKGVVGGEKTPQSFTRTLLGGDQYTDAAGKIVTRDKTLLGKIGSKLGGRAMLADNLSEGAQEMLQFSFEKGAEGLSQQYFNNYLEGTYDPMRRMAFGDVVMANLHGMKEAFTSKEGWESFFVGFLTGYPVHGMISGANRLKGNKTEAQAQREAVDAFNAFDLQDLMTNSPQVLEFLERNRISMNDALAQQFIAEQKALAEANGDVFMTKNLNQDALINFVRTGIQLGKFDARLVQLETLKDLTEDAFTEYFGLEYNEENAAKARAMVDKTIAKAKQMKDIIEVIDNSLPNEFDYKTELQQWQAAEMVKETLIRNTLLLDDINKRIPNVIQKIMSANPMLSTDVLDILINPNILQERYLDNLTKEIKLFNSSLEDTTLLDKETKNKTKAQRNAYQNHVDKVQSLLSKLDEVVGKTIALPEETKGLSEQEKAKAVQDAFSFNQDQFEAQSAVIAELMQEVLAFKISQTEKNSFDKAQELYDLANSKDLISSIIDLRRLQNAMSLLVDQNGNLQTPQGRKKAVQRYVDLHKNQEDQILEIAKRASYQEFLKNPDEAADMLREENAEALSTLEGLKVQLQGFQEELEKKRQELKTAKKEAEKLRVETGFDENAPNNFEIEEENGKLLAEKEEIESFLKEIEEEQKQVQQAQQESVENKTDEELVETLQEQKQEVDTIVENSAPEEILGQNGLEVTPSQAQVITRAAGRQVESDDNIQDEDSETPFPQQTEPSEAVSPEKIEETIENNIDNVVTAATEEAVSEEDENIIAQEEGIAKRSVKEYIKNIVKNAINGIRLPKLGQKAREIVRKIMKFIAGIGLVTLLFANTSSINFKGFTNKASFGIELSTPKQDVFFDPTSFQTTPLENCAAYVTNQIKSVVGNEGLIKINAYGNAWRIGDNIVSNKMGTYIYNVFNEEVPPLETKEEITAYIKAKITESQPLDLSTLREGDIVNLFYEGSSYTVEAFQNGKRNHTSHVGIIKRTDSGKLVLEHNIHGTIVTNNFEDVVAGRVPSIKGKMLISGVVRVNYEKAGFKIVTPAEKKANNEVAQAEKTNTPQTPMEAGLGLSALVALFRRRKQQTNQNPTQEDIIKLNERLTEINEGLAKNNKIIQESATEKQKRLADLETNIIPGLEKEIAALEANISSLKAEIKALEDKQKETEATIEHLTEGKPEPPTKEEVKTISEESPITDIEAKKEELKKREKNLENVEQTRNRNANHPLFNVGQKYDIGFNLEVRDFKDERKDTSKDGVEVITRVYKPATVDENGKMTSSAEVEVTIFDSIEQANEFIDSQYEKYKSLATDRINKVKQELAALEQGSVIEQTPEDIESGIEQSESEQSQQEQDLGDTLSLEPIALQGIIDREGVSFFAPYDFFKTTQGDEGTSSGKPRLERSNIFESFLDLYSNAELLQGFLDQNNLKLVLKRTNTDPSLYDGIYFDTLETIGIDSPEKDKGVILTIVHKDTNSVARLRKVTKETPQGDSITYEVISEDQHGDSENQRGYSDTNSFTQTTTEVVSIIGALPVKADTKSLESMAATRVFLKKNETLSDAREDIKKSLDTLQALRTKLNDDKNPITHVDIFVQQVSPGVNSVLDFSDKKATMALNDILAFDYADLEIGLDPSLSQTGFQTKAGIPYVVLRNSSNRPEFYLPAIIPTLETVKVGNKSVLENLADILFVLQSENNEDFIANLELLNFAMFKSSPENTVKNLFDDILYKPRGEKSKTIYLNPEKTEYVIVNWSITEEEKDAGKQFFYAKRVKEVKGKVSFSEIRIDLNGTGKDKEGKPKNRIPKTQVQIRKSLESIFSGVRMNVREPYLRRDKDKQFGYIQVDVTDNPKADESKAQYAGNGFTVRPVNNNATKEQGEYTPIPLDYRKFLSASGVSVRGKFQDSFDQSNKEQPFDRIGKSILFSPDASNYETELKKKQELAEFKRIAEEEEKAKQSQPTQEPTAPVSTQESGSDVEKRREKVNNEFESYQEEIDKINRDEIEDREKLIQKLFKKHNVFIPKNTRVVNWSIEELIDGKWKSFDIKTKGGQEAFFGKENWANIVKAKKEFDVEFKKLEKINANKVDILEQKQRDLLSTVDGLELRRAWSLGLIKEPNIIGLDFENFVEKETEFIKGEIVEKENYIGYYYLPNTKANEEWTEDIVGQSKQEVIDKINAKYDEELKTLEQSTQTQQEPVSEPVITTPVAPDNLSENKDNSSLTQTPQEESEDDIAARIQKRQEERKKERGTRPKPNLKTDSSKLDTRIEAPEITQEDIEKVKSIFGNDVNIKQLYDVANSNAWATWTAAAITLFKGSNRSDLYHEAWHNFSQLYLTKEEKIKLYGEVRNKVEALKDATDKEVEEHVAREFSKYAIADGKYDLGKLKETKSVFRKILDFLKKLFVVKNNQLENLFEILYKGQIQNYKPSTGNILYSSLNSEINNNFSSRERDRVITAVDGLFAQVLQDNQVPLSALSALSPEAIAYLYEETQFAFEDIQDALIDENGKLVKGGKVIAQNTEKILDNWEDVKRMHFENSEIVKPRLRNFELNEEGEIVSKEPEEEERGRNAADFKESSMLSFHDQVDPEVLALIQTLPQYNRLGNLVIDKEYGTPMLVNSEEMINVLLETLNGTLLFDLLDSKSKTSMIAKLQALSKKQGGRYKTIEKALLPRLLIFLEEDSPTIASMSMFAKFTKIATRPKNEMQLTVVERFQENNAKAPGEYNYSNSVLINGKFSTAKEELRTNFFLAPIEKDSVFSTDPNTQERILLNNEETKTKLNQLLKTTTEENTISNLKAIGVSHEYFTNLSLADTKRLISAVLKALPESGKGITDIMQVLQTKETYAETIKIVEQIVKSDPSKATNSYQNADGKLENEINQWSRINFLSAAINSGKSLTDLIARPEFAYLANNRNNSILRMFFEPSGAFKRKNVSEMKVFNKNGVLTKKNPNQSESEGVKSKNMHVVESAIRDVQQLLTEKNFSTMQLSDKSSVYSVTLPDLMYKPKILEATELFNTFENSIQNEIEIVRQFKKDNANPNNLVGLARLEKLRKNIIENGQLQFGAFREIFNEDLRAALLDSDADIKTLLRQNKAEIGKQLLDYFRKEATDFKNYMNEKSDLGEYVPENSSQNIKGNPIGKKFIDHINIPGYSKDGAIEAFVVNQFLFNMASSDILFGNTYSHKDPFKRIAGASSTGTAPITDDVFLNKFLQIPTETLRTKFTNFYSQEFGVQLPQDPVSKIERLKQNKFVILKDETPESVYKKSYIDTANALIKDLEGELKKARNKEKRTKLQNQINSLQEKRKAIEAGYKRPNEADAFGAMSLDFFRTSMNQMGAWNPKLERVYKKSTAWGLADLKYQYYSDLKDNAGSGSKIRLYNEKAMEAFQEREANELTSEEIEMVEFTVQKFQYFGDIINSQLSNYTETAFHKFELMPLIPQLVSGTQWQKHVERMLIEDVDYILFDSGNKLEKDIVKDSFYEDENRESVRDIMTPEAAQQYSTGDTTYNVRIGNIMNLREQVKMDTAPHSEEILFGTQIRKLIFNFYSEGKVDTGDPAFDAKIEKLKSEFDSNIAELVNIEKERVYKAMSLSVENGNFVIKDMEQFMSFLKKELEKKNINKEAYNYFALNQDKQFARDIDVSIYRKAMENVIVSIINKKIVSQKMKGEQKVQIPVTGFQSYRKSLVKAKNKDNGTNGLRFYGIQTSTTGDKPTVVRKMQVKIALKPNTEFAKLLRLKHEDGNPIGTDTEKWTINRASITRLNYMISKGLLDTRSLTLIGYRIPTQEHNSIEIMEVAEFLDPLFGSGIIVPTEITAKAGSDFDIDKMNTFFPSIGEDGKYKEIGEQKEIKKQISLQEFETRKEELKARVQELRRDKNLEIDVFEYRKGRIITKYQEIREAILGDIKDIKDRKDRLKLMQFIYEMDSAQLDLDILDLALEIDAIDANEQLILTSENQELLRRSENMILKALYQKSLNIDKNTPIDAMQSVVLQKLNSVLEAKRELEGIREQLQFENRSQDIKTLREELNIISFEKDKALSILKEGLISTSMEYSELIADTRDLLSYIYNYKDIKQNEIISTISEAVLNPENFINFITPNATYALDSVVEDIIGLIYPEYVDQNGKINLDVKLTKMFSQLESYKKQDSLWEQKDVLGISAQANVYSQLFRQANLQMTPFKTRLVIPQTKDGTYSLAADTTGAGTPKSTVFGQVINFNVDAANSPQYSYVNTGIVTAPVMMLLNQLGHDEKTTLYFTNQPIIRRLSNFEKLRRNARIIDLKKREKDKFTFESIKPVSKIEEQLTLELIRLYDLGDKNYDVKVGSGDNTQLIDIRFLFGRYAKNEAKKAKAAGKKVGDYKFDFEDIYEKIKGEPFVADKDIMRKSIVLYEKYKRDPEFRKELRTDKKKQDSMFAFYLGQMMMLEDFLELSEQSQDLRKVQDAVKYDTGKSLSVVDAQTRIQLYEELQKSGKFINLDKLRFESTTSPFAVQHDIVNLMQMLMPVTSGKEVTEFIVDKLNNEFAMRPTRVKQKFQREFVNDLVQFIFQTMHNDKFKDYFKLVFNTDYEIQRDSEGKETQRTFNEFHRKMLENFYKRIMTMRNAPENQVLFEKYPLLKNAFINASPLRPEYKNVGISFPSKDIKAENDYIDQWRELKAEQGRINPSNPQSQTITAFMDEFALFGFLQSGLGYSYLSYSRIADNEVLANLLSFAKEEFIKQTQELGWETVLNYFYEQFIQNNNAFRTYDSQQTVYDKTTKKKISNTSPRQNTGGIESFRGKFYKWDKSIIEKLSGKTFDMQQAIEKAKSLSSIEQNFKDGDGKRTMQPEFKGKSTMDLILSGDRTRTTRAKTDINRMIKDYGLSDITELVGKVIRMTDKKGREVFTQITDVNEFTQEYQDRTWQQEGWTKDVTDKLVGKYPYAIEFKVISQPQEEKEVPGCSPTS